MVVIPVAGSAAEGPQIWSKCSGPSCHGVTDRPKSFDDRDVIEADSPAKDADE